MALRSREKFIDVLQYCQTGIASDLRNVLNFSLDGDDIVILKRNKCLKNGDFLGVVRKWKTNRAVSGRSKKEKTVTPGPGLTTSNWNPICQHIDIDDSFQKQTVVQVKSDSSTIPNSEDIMVYAHTSTRQ